MPASAPQCRVIGSMNPAAARSSHSLAISSTSSLRPELGTPESPWITLGWAHGVRRDLLLDSGRRAGAASSASPHHGALCDEATPRPRAALPEPAGTTLNELQATPAPASCPRWRRSAAGGTSNLTSNLPGCRSRPQERCSIR